MTPKEFNVIIEPGRRKSFYWRDIWRFKGLFYYLAWRDILVRYKQTAIGILWSVSEAIAYHHCIYACL